MKKIICFILVFVMLLFVSCKKESSDNEKGIYSEPSTTISFDSITDFYSFFFDVGYPEFGGDFLTPKHIEADTVKNNHGEKYLNFIDDIQSGKNKIYIPVTSDEWITKDNWVQLYTNDTPLSRPAVWYGYTFYNNRIVVKIAYLSDDEVKKYNDDVTELENSVRDLASSEKKAYSKSYDKQIKLKDRTVLSRVGVNKKNGLYDVRFVYDGLYVNLWHIDGELLTEDFLSEFAIQEYSLD